MSVIAHPHLRCGLGGPLDFVTDTFREPALPIVSGGQLIKILAIGAGIAWVLGLFGKAFKDAR